MDKKTTDIIEKYCYTINEVLNRSRNGQTTFTRDDVSYISGIVDDNIGELINNTTRRGILYDINKNYVISNSMVSYIHRYKSSSVTYELNCDNMFSVNGKFFSYITDLSEENIFLLSTQYNDKELALMYFYGKLSTYENISGFETYSDVICDFYFILTGEKIDDIFY